METMSVLIELRRRMEERMEELKAEANRFAKIDNYAEIARLRELQSLHRFFNQIHRKEKKS